MSLSCALARSTVSTFRRVSTMSQMPRPLPVMLTSDTTIVPFSQSSQTTPICPVLHVHHNHTLVTSTSQTSTHSTIREQSGMLEETKAQQVLCNSPQLCQQFASTSLTLGSGWYKQWRRRKTHLFVQAPFSSNSHTTWPMHIAFSPLMSPFSITSLSNCCHQSLTTTQH